MLSCSAQNAEARENVVQIATQLQAFTPCNHGSPDSWCWRPFHAVPREVAIVLMLASKRFEDTGCKPRDV